METEFWLAWRLLFSKNLFSKTSILSLVGLVLGVGSLVVAMAVVSGFEYTLRKTMVDIAGHVQVIGKGSNLKSFDELNAEIKSITPGVVDSTRFLMIEGVLASKGKVAGVLVQGVEPDKIGKVLNISDRILVGNSESVLANNNDGLFSALIGKGLASRYNLSVGDKFKVVHPVANGVDPSAFQRKIQEFEVRGILNLGRFDWNERMIITSLQASQELAELPGRYSGVILKYSEDNEARDAAFKLANKLSANYLIRDWHESNENLFEAIKIEKPIIFLVILIIVLVAAFNISSSLFISVVQRFSDIAILKTLGLNQKQVIKIFGLQGILMGGLGLVGGFLFGGVLSLLFVWGQKNLNLIPADVYRIDNIALDFRWMDWFWIVLITLLVCFVASLVPARKASRLDPSQGLRYG